MLYTYTCPSCGWSGDKISSIADRDAQRCAQIVERVYPSGTLISSSDGDEVHDSEIIREPCGTLLKREEISPTAVMPEQWAQWRSKK